MCFVLRNTLVVKHRNDYNLNTMYFLYTQLSENIKKGKKKGKKKRNTSIDRIRCLYYTPQGPKYH